MRLHYTYLSSIALSLILVVSLPIKAAENSDLTLFNRFIKILRGFNPSTPDNCPPSGGRYASGPVTSANTAAPSPSLYKDETELKTYFDCYLDSKNHLKTAESKYLPMIKTAAEAFELPPTVLACLFFRESMFNPRAKSKVGAVGLSQQMPNNLKYISNLLTARSADDEAALAEISKKTPEEHREARGNQINLSSAQQEVRLAQVKYKNLRLMRRWEKYFSTLNANGLHKGAIPRRLNTANIVNHPEIAIGAGALYLREILITFKNNLHDKVETDQSGEESDPDLLLAAVGAYNMGPGGETIVKGKSRKSGAYAFIYNVKDKNYSAWVAALKKANPETANHIKSIENCIRTSASGDAFAPPAGTRVRDCKASDTSEVNDTAAETPRNSQLDPSLQIKQTQPGKVRVK